MLVVICVSAFAQSTSGELSGTIYDQQGASVSGATVTAKNVGTGVEAKVTSSSSGQYRIPNLLVGTYTLTVSASGFAKSELHNIPVTLNQIATANVTLKVGDVAAVMEVTDTAAVIDTTTSQLQSSYDARQLQNLPTATLGSGIINLSLLAPGVASSGGIGAGTGPSVGGQRPRNNNFMIEGVDNNDKSVTGPMVQIPNDAVAEFTLLQNQFSPEFGHSSGGQFNTVIKSGSNEYHGLAYEYFQNRNLNAADQLSVVSGVDPRPRYDNNRFGGVFGGPILKNKLFFLVNYEYNPVGQAGSPGQIFAPTQAGYDALAKTPGISANNLAILKQYLPAQGTAVPEGSTPAGAYPVVNGTPVQLGQYSILAPNYTNSHSAVASIDYNISDKDSLRGRFITNRQTGLDTAAALPTFYTSLPYNAYTATMTEFHNFTPNLVNELRLGFSRSSQVYSVGDHSIPGLDAFPNLTIDELNINIGPDPNAPQGTTQNNYQLNDNVSWNKGRHNLKVGFSIQKHISPQSFTQRSRGDYEWGTLEGFLLDQVPDQYAERSLGNPQYYGDQISTGYYANDQWKIRSNFTLNLGLRYEYTTVPFGERSQALNSLSSVPGLITFGEPKAQKNAIMPRVGFAWSPGRSGTTSIRGGFGMNYDVLFDNLGILSLPPQLSQTVTLTGTEGGNFLANGGIKPNTATGPLSVDDARAATSGFIPDQKLPKSLQWNFGIQHVFREDYTVEVRYLGTRGINLPIQQRLNDQSVVNSSNALPLFYSMPSQATLDGLTNTRTALVDAYNEGGFFTPSYLNAGFQSPITAYMPIGNSVYHGLSTQVTRRFNKGLQFTGSYTWSHNIDDSTAEVFSTLLTPRRPQDFQNLRAERGSSALDHRNRLSVSMVYDLPFFKSSNWALKNLVGNWMISPMYVYQTGTLYTVQSATDANLNLDAYTDRAVINPNGTANVGSGTTALTNTNGDVVGYLVNNPNAKYIRAATGMLPNGGRNTAHLNPINNLDLSMTKRVSVTERYHVEFSAQALNVFNHAQYTGGYLSDVRPIGFTSTAERNFLTPGTSTFYQPDQVFSSNPRNMQLSLKFIF